MSADYEIRRLEQKLSNLEFDKDAELAALRARIAELEAENGRLRESAKILKDIDGNKSAVISNLRHKITELEAEREQLIDQHISELADLHVKITSIEHDYLEYKALKEYGNENGDEK